MPLKILRIRMITVVEFNDAMLIGNRLVMRSDLSDFGYSDAWKAVTVKVRCHTEWIVTDATKADWDAYVASLDAGGKA